MNATEREVEVDEEDVAQRCSTEGCENLCDDGEGWDGLCGECADRQAALEHCDDCGEELEESQIGRCDNCRGEQ